MFKKIHGSVKIALFAGLVGLAACTSRSSPVAMEVSDTRCGPKAAACNLVAGYSGNSLAGGIDGAAIAGGGQSGAPNRVSGNFGTVGGGEGNTAGEGSTVAGGSANTALHFHATVGGGSNNLASAEEATVAGGLNNTANDRFATVGGGATNLASSFFSTVSGGSGNTASFNFASVGGGTYNQSTNEAAVVPGGNHNLAQGPYSAILGGINNTANGLGAAVGGGAGNIAGGIYSMIPGGFANQAAGDFSFAAGRDARVNAAHPGSFLFADSNDFPFPSTAPNEFAVRASGGVRLVTAIDSIGNPLAGVRLSPGSGAWDSLSDSQSKAGIRPVDGNQVLERLMSLQVSTWNYRGQAASIRHIGPMAQDFYSAFQVGDDNHYISTVDEEGVALAAIQQVYRLVQQERSVGSTGSPAGNASLQAQVASLQRQLTFSNGLAVAALLIASLSFWRRKKGPVRPPRRIS
jgi:hypothetical protein